MILHPICPGCGHRDAVNESAVGQIHACSNCGCRYEVGIIEVSPSDFSEGNVGVTCPYCGHVNSAPPQAADHDVACAVCDGTFHLRLVEDEPEEVMQREYESEKNKAYVKLWATIMFAVAVTVFITLKLGGWWGTNKDSPYVRWVKKVPFKEYPLFQGTGPKEFKENGIYAYDRDDIETLWITDVTKISDNEFVATVKFSNDVPQPHSLKDMSLDHLWVAKRQENRDYMMECKIIIPHELPPYSTLPSMLVSPNGFDDSGIPIFKMVCYRY